MWNRKKLFSRFCDLLSGGLAEPRSLHLHPSYKTAKVNIAVDISCIGLLQWTSSDIGNLASLLSSSNSIILNSGMKSSMQKWAKSGIAVSVQGKDSNSTFLYSNIRLWNVSIPRVAGTIF